MKSILLILLAALPVLAGDTLFAYSLYLQPQAISKQDVVRLGDIARIEGEAHPGALRDKVVVQGLERPLFVSREELTARLARGPEKLDRVYGRGVWIVPLTKRLSTEKVLSALIETLARKSGGREFLEGHRLVVEGQASLDGTPDPGSLHFVLPERVELLSPGLRMVTVDVRGSENGRERVLMRQHVPVRIYRRVTVAVAVRSLAAGERLVRGDWRTETRDIDYEPGRYLSGDLSGRRVMSNLAAGALLTASTVQNMPAVRRGGRVELVYQTPGLVIKCATVAGRDGTVGEVIPVTAVFPSGRGRRELNARIVDEGRAVLVE